MQDSRPELPLSARPAVASGRPTYLRRFEIDREADRAVIDFAMEVTTLRALAAHRVTELSAAERAGEENLAR